jgi:hypothetical protein
VAESFLRRRRAPARCAVLLVCAGCGAAAGARPEVLFRDDFNGENGGLPMANDTALEHWQVVAGSVDLMGTYPFEVLPPGHGMYVDLDGATGHAGTLRTRALLDLAPGDYLLTFVLAGPQRQSAPNTVHVSLGSLYAEPFTRGPFDAPIRLARRVHVTAPQRVRIEFRHEGGDNFGMLLDDVELRRL